MSRDAKKLATLPYQSWWQSFGHKRRCRREVLSQMGRAPINLPPRPARLELIRNVAPLSEDYSDTTQLLNTAPGFFGSSRHVGALPRSFSGECCQVVTEQAPIEFFDAPAVYRSCPLFQRCSPGFIEKLMATGGRDSSQGKIWECGSTIYVEGQRGSSLYVIVRGSILLISGATKTIVGPGESVGASQGLGVLAERQETAMAETSVHLLEVTLSALTTIFTEKEDFAAPSCFGGQTSGTLYARERRHFEAEAKLRGKGKAASSKSKGRRATMIRKPQDKDEAETERGHISCLQHPRKWREQVQKLQRELNDGDFSDGGKVRENFSQSLYSSITQDFNYGYQQPMDSPMRPNIEDRHTPDDETAMLELSLLPSFPDMSCKQKVDLYHHMNAQNKARSRSYSARLPSRSTHEDLIRGA